MERLESVRSKARYLLIGRDDTKGMIFPVPALGDIMVGLTIDVKADGAEICDFVTRSVSETLNGIGDRKFFTVLT